MSSITSTNNFRYFSAELAEEALDYLMGLNATEAINIQYTGKEGQFQICPPGEEPETIDLRASRMSLLIRESAHNSSIYDFSVDQGKKARRYCIEYSFKNDPINHNFFRIKVSKEDTSLEALEKRVIVKESTIRLKKQYFLLQWGLDDASISVGILGRRSVSVLGFKDSVNLNRITEAFNKSVRKNFRKMSDNEKKKGLSIQGTLEKLYKESDAWIAHANLFIRIIAYIRDFFADTATNRQYLHNSGFLLK